MFGKLVTYIKTVAGGHQEVQCDGGEGVEDVSSDSSSNVSPISDVSSEVPAQVPNVEYDGEETVDNGDTEVRPPGNDYVTENKVTGKKRKLRKIEEIDNSLLDIDCEKKKKRCFEWSDSQKRTIVLARKGYNLLVTGCAGSGKSALLRQIKDELLQMGKVVATTSSTGISALNIHGVTIHRCLGIGYARSIDDMRRVSRYKQDYWRRIETLILDEISMVDKDLLDNIDALAREYRKTTMPMGGMQVLIFGDFFQLQPCFKVGRVYSRGQYAIFSRLLKYGIDFYINFAEVFRQKDSEFVKVLNNVRVGNLDSETCSILRSRIVRFDEDYWKNHTKLKDIPTYITSSRGRSSEINQRFFFSLKGKIYDFRAVDFCSKNCGDIADVLNETGVPFLFKNRKNSRVVLTYNLNNKFVNGSRGTTTHFKRVSLKTLRKFALENGCSKYLIEGISTYYKVNDVIIPFVLFDGKSESIPVFPVKHQVKHEDRCYTRIQIPLLLAWSLTTHRLQGWEVDTGAVAQNKLAFRGQFYSAVSRVKTLEGLSLKSFEPGSISTSFEVLEWMKTMFGEDFNEKDKIVPSKVMKNKIIELKNKKRRIN